MSRYLTIAGKQDGFGAQYQACMSGIAYCAHRNYRYIHTPFKRLEHGEDAVALNRFTGLVSDEEAAGEQPDIIEPYISEVHCATQPDRYYTPAVLDKIRKMYYSVEKPERCRCDIAIHIRRGDVNAASAMTERKFARRYTDNAYYRDLIERLRHRYPDHTICIYSVGEIKDFDSLKLDESSLCLNEDIEKTFHALVTAEVLVTSKSSFSYAAALLSEGKVWYMPFWHKPLSHWTVLPESSVPSA